MAADQYLLLDGHSRLDVLKQLGEAEVRCTIATDDEAYTYNRKVNYVSNVGQHFMILKALENGVPEERLAEALNVNITNIHIRRDLLDGICPEAVRLLRDRKVPMGTFEILRKMKPVRQVEAAEHMVAVSTYSITFAKALLAVTKPEMLVKAIPKPKVSANSVAAQEMLGAETQRLVKDLNAIEESYGKNILALTVCAAYVRKMIGSSLIRDYLSRTRPEVLGVLKQQVGALESA